MRCPKPAVFLLAAFCAWPAGWAAQSATPAVPTCQEALAAQDEVISLQGQQVTELKASIAARQQEVGLMKAEIDSLHTQIGMLAAMLKDEQEYADRQAKRAKWQEFWTGLKYGSLGLSLGVLADRYAGR